MASKKNKNVVRCVSCGVKAEGHISVEPVCKDIACHEYVKECIKAFVAEQNKK